MTRTLAAALAVVLPAAATAQDTLTDVPEEVEVRYQRETHVDFETVNVGGTLVAPSVTWLEESQRKGFQPLIRLRVDWNAELSASLDEVR